jgi:hypothetical protein
MALTLFILLAGFLIWGLINLLSNFSIQANGWLTFLSVLAPHVLSLSYVAVYIVQYILSIKSIRQKNQLKSPKQV